MKESSVSNNNISVDLDKVISCVQKQKKCSIKVLHLDFDSFFSKLGIKNFEGADGFLFTNYCDDCNENVIGVNKTFLENDAYFSRFIIAHELGHICLSHHNKNGLHISPHIKSCIDFDDRISLTEKEANK